LRFFIWQTRLRGGNPRRVGVNKDLDLVAILEHSLPISTWIDIRAYFEDWDRASACHASQAGPRQNMPQWQRRLLMSQQGLTRAYPAWQPGQQREGDLFAGLDA
jgi:LmbE family N-acetylglucosaminyl deacetylase